MIHHLEFYEATSWPTPVAMARKLLPRHEDLSTVRAMLRNEFGRAPSVDVLARIRSTLPKPPPNHSWHDGAPINVSTEGHDAEMAMGSRALLVALWQRHQRVMLVAEACGRQVVRL